MNVHTGVLAKWDDLTPEQQQSGEWIKLPPESDAGVVLTRRRNVLDSIGVRQAGRLLGAEAALAGLRSGELYRMG